MFSKLLPKLRVKNDVKIVYIMFGIVMTYFSIYMPDFISVADTGNIRISSTVSFGALNGMLFGPLWGAFISIVGYLLYKLTSGTILSMSAVSQLSIMFLALSSVVSGLVVNREHKAARTIFFALIIMWFLSDIGRTVYFYPWYHLLVLGAFVFFEKSILEKTVTSRTFTFISFFLAALLGVLTDHLAGSIVYQMFFDLSPSDYVSVMWVYPIERTILAFFPAFLLYVLVVVFKDILISSDTIEAEIEKKKAEEVDKYVFDVIKMMEEDDMADNDENNSKDK